MVAFALTDSDRDTDGGASSTFTLDIGSGGAERTLLFAVFTVAAAASPTLVTIASVNESGGAVGIDLLQHGSNPGGIANQAAWFAIRAAELIDPNDTSISVVVTPSASTLRTSIAVYMTADAVDIDTLFHSDTDESNAENPTVFNLSINVAEQGAVLLAGGLNCSSAVGTSFAFTGVTDPGDVEDTAAANVCFGVSQNGNMSAETARALSLTIDASGEDIGVAAAISLAPIAAPARSFGVIIG
jgi:hypothetical protein